LAISLSYITPSGAPSPPSLFRSGTGLRCAVWSPMALEPSSPVVPLEERNQAPVWFGGTHTPSLIRTPSLTTQATLTRHLGHGDFLHPPADVVSQRAGKSLVSVGTAHDSQLVVWDWRQGLPLLKRKLPHPQAVHALCAAAGPTLVSPKTTCDAESVAGQDYMYCHWWRNCLRLLTRAAASDAASMLTLAAACSVGDGGRGPAARVGQAERQCGGGVSTRGRGVGRAPAAHVGGGGGRGWRRHWCVGPHSPSG
jgi:hypothetical protein